MRPSWDCACCGKPWPCDPAREHLAAEHQTDPTATALYLHTQAALAAEDLPVLMPGDRFDRFLAWLRPTL